MKVFMIGGTGPLGSEAAKELIARGHEVSSLALPPLPTGAVLPPEMKLEFGNYLEMSDEELKQHFQGCEGFVFAAGVDERVEGPAPIYDLYKKYNIDPVKRLLGLCRECGVKHVAICGSYVSYAARKWPEKELTKWHPYIKSRIDQEAAAMAFADDMDVAVPELPYIFGTQPGRKSVWVFLVENVMSMKKVTMYPKGGSTMVTVHQVGQAIAGAIEKNRGGKLLSESMQKGDWKTKLRFCCAFGHEFEASPRLVLEGGHWCPVCERKSWNYGARAKVDPFFAQVWDPLHEPDELREYPKEVTELDV